MEAYSLEFIKPLLSLYTVQCTVCNVQCAVHENSHMALNKIQFFYPTMIQSNHEVVQITLNCTLYLAA